MKTRNVSGVAPEVVAETRRTSGQPEVNHRARAIQVIEKTLAPLFELRGFMQEHPDFTAAQFSGLWMKFEGDFENGLRLATDEVYNARGGSERIEFARAKLPARFIDPAAPVRQRAQALVGAIAEQCEAILTFLRSDPDGFDPAGYCTALDQVTKAVSRWGKLLGDIPYELMSTQLSGRLLLTHPSSREIAPQIEIELDAGGERIERVLTYRDDDVEALPFGSLSGGTKEQVALPVRVILARLIAAQNPDRREILILDDPLTQSDEARRPALYRVLRQASEHVQIVFVTSHSDTAGLAPEQVISFQPQTV